MSSFRNASKAAARSHKERSQPAARAHKGLLEKKKDYKLRAVDHQKKQNAIKRLKRKALDKNPEEFYFNMINTKLEEGQHKNRKDGEAPEHSDSHMKKAFDKDLSYIKHVQSIERKKIDRLKGELHLIGADAPKNKHTFFVDSKKEKKRFDLAERLDTHPSLLGRTYNRPTLKQLSTGALAADPEIIVKLAGERQARYKELTRRLERQKKLKLTAQKIEARRHVITEKKRRKKQVVEESKDAAAVFKFLPYRK